MASRFTTFEEGQNRFNCLERFTLNCGLGIFPSTINKSQVQLYNRYIAWQVRVYRRRDEDLRAHDAALHPRGSRLRHDATGRLLWGTDLQSRLTGHIVLQNCNTLLYSFLIFVTGRWFCSCVFSLAWFCFHRNVLYLDNTGECHQERPGGGGGGGGHEPERDGEDRR